MAFFGITALGPQNIYSAARPEVYNISIFELDEFATAFDDYDKHKIGSVAVDSILNVVKLVYHGEVPKTEEERITNAFRSFDMPSFTRDQFLQVIGELQKQIDITPIDNSKTAHYQSFQLFRAHKLREVRSEFGPADVYAKPLTQLQDVGWRAKETPVGYTRCPKKHCEETKFMGELFKAGVI